MDHRLKLLLLICLSTGRCAGMVLPMEERKVLERVGACKTALDIPSTGQAKAGGSRSEFLGSRQELFHCLPFTELWEMRDMSGAAEQLQPLLLKSPMSAYKLCEAPSDSPERTHQQQDQASAAEILPRTGPKMRRRHLRAPARNPC